MSIFKKIIKAIKSLFCKEKKKEILLPFKSYLWNLNRLDNLTKSLITKINKSAEIQLNVDNILITDKPAEFVDDRREYVSLATYYWPNPDTEDGMPYIVKDGYPNPKVKEYDLYKLIDLQKRLRDIVFSYYLNKDNYTCELFVFCSQVYNFFVGDNSMYPKFEYCQIGPGSNNNKGINTFESYYLINIFESIGFMNTLKPLPENLITSLQEWLKKLVKYIKTSKPGQFENRMENNHSIMYDVGLIYFSLLANGKLDNDIVKRLYKRIDEQIDDDGKQPQELKRNQGYHYSIYNLEHIIDGIKIIQNAGGKVPENIMNKVDKAFDFLYTFKTVDEFNENYQEIGNFDNCKEYMDSMYGRIHDTDFNYFSDLDYVTL